MKDFSMVGDNMAEDNLKGAKVSNEGRLSWDIYTFFHRDEIKEQIKKLSKIKVKDMYTRNDDLWSQQKEKDTVHVVTCIEGWCVHRSGTEYFEPYETKDEALVVAEKMSKEQKIPLYIHNNTGSVEKRITPE